MARLRRDPFFFATLIVTLWFASFLLAITWYAFRDWPLLLATLAVVGAACWLFYAREEPRQRKR